MLTEIQISLIDGRNMRNGYSVDDLVESFTKHGQLSKVRVRPHPTKRGRYEMIFGNRRLGAALKLGWKTIAADVVEATNLESEIMAFVENVDRQDVTDYEKASFLETMHNSSGKSYSEIAAMIGKSPSYVSQHVSMLSLFSDIDIPEQDRSEVLQSLTEGHCRVLSSIGDVEERWNTAKLAVASKMGVRELEKLAGRFHHVPKERGRRKDYAIIREVITRKMTGLNSKDVRPFFDSMSQKHFDMFSSFPPFNRLNRELSREQICKILNGMNSFNAEIDNLEVTFLTDRVAYATMEVTHNFLFSRNKVTTKTRATIILEREDRWRIVHEHWSSENPEKFFMATLSQVVDRRQRMALTRKN